MYNINYYTVLGLTYPSSQEKIKTAYHNLSKIHHPDVGGNPEKMKILNQAYDVLSNPSKKAKYDAWLLEIIKKDINSKYNQSEPTSSQPHRQEQPIKFIMHLLTIEGHIEEKYIDVHNLNIDYKKYMDEYNQLYFYEMRQGSKISTIITYKTNWYDMMYKMHPEKKPKYPFSVKHSNFINIVIPIIIMIVIIALCSFCSSDTDNNTAYDYSTPHPTGTPRPSLPPKESLPENGTMFLSSSQECVAPLTINTAETSDNYYIYLKYYGEDRSRDMSFFVRSNSTLNIDVPLGTYEMFYCIGLDWYGTKFKFGYNTTYCTSDELLEFTLDDEYVYGHTLTLYPVSNGNFETEQIDESEFPG